MQRRLIISLVTLTIILSILGSILMSGIGEKASIETVLIDQAYIQGLINNLIVSIKNAQLIVFMKQAGYVVENDEMVGEINKFDEFLNRLERKYKLEINTQNCLGCHVSIDAKMTQIDQRLSSVKKLVQKYKMKVSTLFTTLDDEIRDKREKEIGLIGNDIIKVTNQIHHITTTMLGELDRATKRGYIEARQKTMWSLSIGGGFIFLVIGYLFFSISGDVQRFVKNVDFMGQSQFNEKMYWDTDKEFLPLVDAFNGMVDVVRSLKEDIAEKEEETRKNRYYLDELKLTMEDKVRQRTEELNQTNRELIENQLKLERTYSEIQEKTKELAENNIRLQELDKMKSDFIQMTNHEIRTPVVTIKGYTEVLISGTMGKLSPKVQNALKIMNRSVTRLTSIIESTRAYTMTDSKGGKLHLGEMVIAEFLNDVYSDMRMLTEKRMQRLVVDIPQKCPIITCDVVQIYQAMVNLVINSIRYSPDNSDIIIGASYPRGANAVTFWVKDNGMGIETKELRNIFLPYYEVKSVREHHSGTIEFNSAGTGLGLAIVKKIIENHDGRVWAESPGSWKGSTFYFTLPLTPKNAKVKTV